MGGSADGSIVIFDFATSTAIDYLRDIKPDVISIDGLWDCNSAMARTLARPMHFISWWGRNLTNLAMPLGSFERR
ncbi:MULTISPECIES: hypothetical protein [Nitrosospira]|uniref:hypothetical protein n=1 Tax=Nitrosospira TaxID=35798 RepID=UPI00115FBF73|nr:MULTISPECIES: hypothetical protein [Nitrosospira]